MDRVFRDNKVLKNCGARLTFFESEALEGHLAFGYVGDYSRMMEPIYRCNILREFGSPSNVRISVVIPVRNFSHTIPYTLETCLNQTYKDYEIVVSDNSVHGDETLSKYIRESENPRLRYVKTPAPLRLAKSFEYAFSQAKGEFVFSIGSDDALLPWGLEMIDQALDKCVHDDVIAWSRGFYVWPNFKEAMNKDQMNIIAPHCHKYAINYIATNEILKLIEQNIQNVYMAPLLYINSGFRRKRFSERVYAKTGALWNGWSQDIYMGALNLFLYDRIPYLSHMATVAGMSNSSIGLNSSLGIGEKVLEYDGVADTAFERQFPISTYDVAHFYGMLLRLQMSGVVPDAYIHKLNWDKILQSSVTNLRVINPLCDRFLQGIETGKSRFVGLCGADPSKISINGVMRFPENIARGYK
jgi:hypothetical protein